MGRLILGVREKGRIRVGNDVVTVDAIEHSDDQVVKNATLEMCGRKIPVTVDKQVKIGEGIYVGVGLKAKNRVVKLIFEAPRSVRIEREPDPDFEVREFRLPRDVAHDAVDRGAVSRVQELLELLELSSPYGSKARRHESHVFLMDGDRVTYVYDESQKSEMVRVECPTCENDGGRCDDCLEKGSIAVRRDEAMLHGWKIMEKERKEEDA